MNAKRETVIGCGLLLGLTLIVFGYFGGVLMLGGGAARMGITRNEDPAMMLLAVLGPVMMGVGILLVVGFLVYGFATLHKVQKAPPTHYPDVLVVARFAINEIGEMVFQDFDPDDPSTKLYVHLKLPGGRNQEYRCPWPVFECCCEGMRGSAVAQGDWLGSFAPFAVQPQTPLV